MSSALLQSPNTPNRKEHKMGKNQGINYQVHRMVEVRGRRGMKQVDYSHPDAYIRLSAKDKGTVYIQGGRLMYEDGETISGDNIPEWVLAEIKKQDPAALKEAGFNIKPILEELEKAKKAKTDKRKEAKLAQAKVVAKAAAKRGQRSMRAEPVDPEPEDVGLSDEDAPE